MSSALAAGYLLAGLTAYLVLAALVNALLEPAVREELPAEEETLPGGPESGQDEEPFPRGERTTDGRTRLRMQRQQPDPSELVLGGCPSCGRRLGSDEEGVYCSYCQWESSLSVREYAGRALQ